MKYTCRYCKRKFDKSELVRMMPQVCKSKECAQAYFNEYSAVIISKAKETIKRKEKARQNALKEASLTKGELLSKAQAAFNAYIRERDKQFRNGICISCGRFVRGSGNASHFYSVGSSPSLRFDEANVHLSCIRCNMHEHGNIAAYEPQLRALIGDEEMNRLARERNKPKHYSREDLKEIERVYKRKYKELKKNTSI